MVCVFKHLYCSAQLSMSNMEKRYRNKIIIIISNQREREREGERERGMRRGMGREREKEGLRGEQSREKGERGGGGGGRQRHRDRDRDTERFLNHLNLANHRHRKLWCDRFKTKSSLHSVTTYACKIVSSMWHKTDGAFTRGRRRLVQVSCIYRQIWQGYRYHFVFLHLCMVCPTVTVLHAVMSDRNRGRPHLQQQDKDESSG